MPNDNNKTADVSSLLDLHAALLADTNGTLKAQVLARLLALHEACAAQKRQLCDRETFLRLEAAGKALAASIRIVQTLRPVGRPGN